MYSGEEQDILNELNEDIAAPSPFGAAQAGTYRVRVSKIEGKIDEQGRKVVDVTEEFVDAESIAPYTPGDKVGRLMKTYYLHTPGSATFFRGFVEGHGISWSDFLASKGLQRFVGLEATVQISVATKNTKTGEELTRARNEIVKFLKS